MSAKASENFKQGVGLEIGNDEGIAGGHFLGRALDQLVDIAFEHIELECLIEEFARRIVVGDAKLGPAIPSSLAGRSSIDSGNSLVRSA